MNINKTEELAKLTTEDYFKAIASEMHPVPLYENGKELPAHEFTELGAISFADAKMVLNIRTDIRRKLIEDYPEYGVCVAQPGDTVCFGSYIQKEGRGADSIEWKVLAREPKKLLLVTKDAVDCRPYHSTYESVSWETSELRKWLNTEFIENAFAQAEKVMIPYTTVVPAKQDNIYSNHGNNTLDKVFLLSTAEVRAYMPENESRPAGATEIAVKNGVALDSANKCCWWWLRTPGWNPMNYTETFVNDIGELKLQGDLINHKDNAVRPAVWVGVD